MEGKSDDEIRDDLFLNLELLSDDVAAVHYYNMAENRIEVSTDTQEEGMIVSRNKRPWAVDPGDLENMQSARSFEPYAVDGEPRMGFISPVAGQTDHAIVVVADTAHRGQLLAPPVENGSVQVVSMNDGRVMLADDPELVFDDFFLLEALPHIQSGLPESRIDEPGGEYEQFGGEQAVVATVPLEQKS